MEAVAGIFKDLYTNFLLRDFAGKIVPGSFLFFSIAILFSSPTDVARTISGRLSFLSVAICAGLAWTVVLGLQRVAEFVSTWSYFPSSAGNEMDVQSTIIEPFLRIACPDERVQYERYVVIKEATGNLFNVAIIAVPAWLIWLASIWRDKQARLMVWGTRHANSRTILLAIYSVVIMFGLHTMNVQHVDKQFELAKKTMDYAANKENGDHMCPSSSDKNG